MLENFIFAALSITNSRSPEKTQVDVSMNDNVAAVLSADQRFECGSKYH